jgi:hypothetical protein
MPRQRVTAIAHAAGSTVDRRDSPLSTFSRKAATQSRTAVMTRPGNVRRVKRTARQAPAVCPERRHSSSTKVDDVSVFGGVWAFED